MSVSDFTTLRQCLRLLSIDDLVSPCLDYRVHKLSTTSLVKVFLAAQLCGWDSLRRIEAEIGADDQLQEELGCSSVSASQLSRRINHAPPFLMEMLYCRAIALVRQKLSAADTPASRPVMLVDSTNIRLPSTLGDWAITTKHRNGVKIHVRLKVVSPGECYPDASALSTGNVSDYEGSDILVTEENTTYIMDRGYVSYKRMDRWIGQKIDFVIRVNDTHAVTILEEHTTDPADPGILRDAKAKLGSKFIWMEHAVRIVEFADAKGRMYRLATTRTDLTAREVADLYKQRWLIELFFRFMKQHLKLVKLYSHQPRAVWNHLLLALTAYVLTYLIQLHIQDKRRSTWDVMRLLRVYACRTWRQFLDAVSQQPSRSSKGRQRREPPQEPVQVQGYEVAHVKQSKAKKK